MATLKVYDKTGSEVGTCEVDTAAIAPSINRQLLHDVVVMYQANQRQGTHRTKSRSEVSGARKKLYRQKGTGNARAGHKRSGVRRGGGHIFARRPRDYSYRLPKKAIRAATKMAVCSKINDEQVVVIDQLDFAEPRTKEMATILKALNLSAESTLVATASHDVNVYKSARNLPTVTVSPISDLNALSVLAPRRLLITKGALEAFQAGATSGSAAEAAAADDE